jgi:glycosyltransferase involved in cell wall biosynthesis
MNQIGAVLAVADILLVHLKNDRLFEITIPSKTQAYLSVGKPILMCVKGDAADLIDESGAGYCVDPEDGLQLASKILEIAHLTSEVIQQKGLDGRLFYDKHLSFDIGVHKTLAVLVSAFDVESKKIKSQ